MHEPNPETRSFYNSCVAKFCGGDRSLVEDGAPIEAICEAALSINERESAERFLAGMLHWVRGRRARTVAEGFTVVASNVKYCLDSELFSEAQVAMWTALLEDYGKNLPREDDPQLAKKRSEFAGQQIKAGKDPGALSALAKKALERAKK